MNRGTQFQFVAGLVLVLSIVAAASVAAHSPLLSALGLPPHLGDVAAGRPWSHTLTLVPPVPTLPTPGRTQLLPNWEVGRNAAVPLPNYEPGTVTFDVLNLGVIPGLASPLAPPRAAPMDAVKP